MTRACLAHRRRAVRRLCHVRAAQLDGQRFRSYPGRRRAIRQRCLHHPRRGYLRLRGRLRQGDEQIRQGDRADEVAFRELDGTARRRARDDGARARPSRQLHHQDVPRVLSLFRRERVQLRQVEVHQSQSAHFRGEPRRRRPEDRVYRGCRVRVGGERATRKSARHPRGERSRSPRRTARKSRAGCSNGASRASSRSGCSTRARK